MKLDNKSILKDAFEFGDKTIPFTVHLARSAQEVYQKRAEIQTLTSDEEKLGKAIVSLYTSIFGEDVVKELLDYFADDAIGLMVDTIPMLSDVVFPAYDRLKLDALDKKKRFKNG